MSTFSEDARDIMLDGLNPTHIQLHDDDPGASGTDGVVMLANGSTPSKIEHDFAAASGGERALDGACTWESATALGASVTVTWYSIWGGAAGADFYGKGEITSGDTAANAAGEFTLTTATKLVLT